jgi:hypothetical protein
LYKPPGVHFKGFYYTLVCVKPPLICPIACNIFLPEQCILNPGTEVFSPILHTAQEKQVFFSSSQIKYNELFNADFLTDQSIYTGEETLSLIQKW